MSATTMVATFRVTTPMFCGGADGRSAELRPASFKGVLRFWWRACAWSHFKGELRKIREEEAKLFGSPDTGQSRVWLRMDQPTVPSKRSHDVLGSDGVRYLGFGLNPFDGSTRECLAEPFDLTVTLRCRGVAPADTELLGRAVTALGTVGGMGARSRRGFGSLSLTRLHVAGEDQPVPTSPADLDAVISGFHGGDPTRLPEYTAFSGQSRHLVLQCDTAHAREVLDQLGMEFADYRRRKRGGWRSQKLAGDHTIATRGTSSGVHPKRIAFGLPLNVFGEKKPVEPVEHTRRASPLLFHIHQFGGKAVAVVSFLPAQFLPKGKSAVTLPKGDRRHVDGGAAVYQPVVDFLDHLEQERPFTPVRQVRR